MKTVLLTAIMLVMALILFAQPNTKWAGVWNRDKNYSLEISDVTNNSFMFVFDCYNGTNMGQAEGTAIIKGNEAISKTNEPDECKIKFILKDDYIEVIDIRENDCLADAGNGIYYDGEYVSGKVKKIKSVISIGFDKFWNDFRAAIINKDAKTVSEMIEFPLLGSSPVEWANVSNNKATFIAKGFDIIFTDLIEDFKETKLSKKITQVKKKDTKYKFEYYYPSGDEEWNRDFYDIILLTYSSKSWAAFFYFAKINGNYKLIKHFAVG